MKLHSHLTSAMWQVSEWNRIFNEQKQMYDGTLFYLSGINYMVKRDFLQKSDFPKLGLMRELQVELQKNLIIIYFIFILSWFASW